MKKGNNSGNDDFSFTTGGGDEYFPLQKDTSNKKDTKAPKGVKGYLKNVAKSVVNLGVKTGKHLYPEAVTLGEKFKPDTTSTTDPKAFIANWKSEAKKYADIGKDIAKSTIKDAKEAIRTGKFVKTEEERNNAEEMFGDMFGDSGFDFDGDSASYDVGGDDSSFDLGSDDDNYKGATLNTSETIVKSSYASARINARLSEKTNATIVGASQTQIKSDRAMFAQNLEISQEQHRQKMLMLTNIASNLGKVIEQGNVSIKAQMEFSAKQLAFSQDLAAMLKEIRDVQWSTVKPKKAGEITKSKFQRIFGDGKAGSFNFKEFAKNFTTVSKSEAVGGAFDMLGTGKEMIDMMLDMGGGAGALKSMLGDVLFESALNKISNKRSAAGTSLLNSKLEGLPGAINRKLGSISRNGSPELQKLLNKLPFGLGKKISLEKLQDMAGWAHVDTDIKVKSGRYDMDPSEVHPFDNAAHKALTEVIPWQLAKIDAGINRTEQEFFDYKSNKWKKISSIKSNLEKSTNDVLEYSNGYSDISERIKFGANITKSFNLVTSEYNTNPMFTSGKLSNRLSRNQAQTYADMSESARKFIIDNQKKIIHNLMLLGSDYEMDEILAALIDKDELGEIFDKVFANTSSIPNGLSDEAIGYYLYVILREFQKSDPENWIKFQIDLSSYKNRLTTNNFENEEKYFTSGGGIAYDASLQSDIFESERKELIKKRDSLTKQLNKFSSNKEFETLNKSKITKLKDSLKEVNGQIRDLDRENQNSTTGILSVHSPSEADKYIISDLNDSSTHGIINNIYNLLLTGLDVYVKNPNGNQKRYHDEIIKHTLGDNGTKLRKPKSHASEIDYSKDSFGVDSVDDMVNGRENEFNSNEQAFLNSKLAKIPGMKALYKTFNGVTQKINMFGNTFLGENFYSEHKLNIDENSDFFKNQMSKEEQDEFRKLKKEYIDAPKKYKDKAKQKLDSFTKSIKNSRGAKALSFGLGIIKSAYNRSDLSKVISALGSKISGIKVGGKTFSEYVAETKNSELVAKLSQAGSVSEQIQIVRDIGTSKAKLFADSIQKEYEKDKEAFDKAFKSKLGASSPLSVISDTIARYKQKANEKIKEQSDKLIKNVLVNKLKKIKVGGKTLGEVLGEISKKDPSFAGKLESFTTMTDLAEFLLQSNNPELLPFKGNIRLMKDKYSADEMQGGVAGVVGMGLVTGFDLIKKSIDVVKNIFKNRKKNSDEEIANIEKYVHSDIIKLLGGPEQTLSIMDELGIDVELTFKDNDYHKASKQIEFILDSNKSIKSLTGKQKRALKGLMKYELDKEAASSSINSIKSSISSITNNFQKEIEKYGDSMTSEERRNLELNRDEDLERATGKLQQAENRKNKAKRKINSLIGDDDGIEGNSANEQREAKRKAKEEKERDKENKMRFGLLSTLVTTLTSWKKDGFKLDKQTTEDMKDAVSEGAAEGSNTGWTGKIGNFMNSTGLGNTKLGKSVMSAVNATKGITNFASKNKTIASFLGKSKGLLATVGGTAVSSGKGLLRAGNTLAAGIGGGSVGTGGLVKVLQKILSVPKIAAQLGKSGATSVISAFKEGAKRVLTKISPKLATLMGMSTNWVGWAALTANAVVSFTKGMSRAKTTFNIGRGLRPTVGMRLACGLAAMLDGVLLGIPGIICKAMGFRNAEEWFYSLIGKSAEKDALARYARYNKMRSTIFGIDDPQALVTYENRNIESGGNFFDNLGAGAKRLGRSIANFATLGFAKNNDERDSQLLGFQSVDIYKMWKERKYIPLTTTCVDEAISKLREEKKNDPTISGMDDAKLKKYLEQMNAVSKEDIDNNDDGEIDDNAKAQAEAAALEHQNLYRKLYLEICRKYVLDNKIAWLNSHCDLEKFKKYTGNEAKQDLSKGDRAKRAASIALNPMGTLISSRLENKGIITGKEGKAVRNTAIALTAATLVAGPLGALAVGTALVAKKAWKERKHIGRAIANAFRRGVTKDLIMRPYKQMESNKKLRAYKDTKKLREQFVKKIIEIVEKYGASHIDEWKDFNDKISKYSPEYNMGIGSEMAESFSKYSDYKYTDENGNRSDMVKATLGVDIPNDHPKRNEISVASGLIGWIMDFMPEVDGMCQSILGMTIKRLAVKMIVTGESIGKLSSNYEKYVTKRAEILGAPQEKLKAYESGLKGSETATGWGRFKAGFKGLFSKKSADELDSRRIGFEDVKIYKYWKQHKYDPIINLEKQIAGKYGKYLEIINKHCEDVEAQNKFIQEFLQAATRFVNDNKLAWLTTRTTLEEFNEFEKNGFKTNASMSSSIAEERNKQRMEIENRMKDLKQGSREYKKYQKELNRLDMANSGSVTKNNIDLNKDFDSLSKELLNGYDTAGLNAHETASDVIQHEIWEQVGANFYGNDKLPNANPISVPGEEKGGPSDMFGAVGSNENLRILQEKISSNAKQMVSSVKKRASDIGNRVTSVTRSAPGLTDKIRSRVNVKETPINDFVVNFRDELIHKLDILNEIHTEQVRHNQVSEDFYSALLNMVAIMAKSQGNTRIASQLDSMVKQVSK